MLEHGGNLAQAIQRFGRVREDWLDLSTGVNPRSYPVPAVPPSAWHRLPEASAELRLAAQDYYGAPELLPVAGTQAAIQALPRLRLALNGIANVVVSTPSYAEHAYQWQRAGHIVAHCEYGDLSAMTDSADVMVIVNPNNPTGAVITPDVLLSWADRMCRRGAWLIVDEAFADTQAELSIAAHTHQPGLIVLRSLGKFFGLAGVRVGFVAAQKSILQALADDLGPWSVSGPAQDIASAALRDTKWQGQNLLYLRQQGDMLRALLREFGLLSSGTDLFQWCSLTDRAEACWQHFAERGIWLRLFPQIGRGVRFGLPADEDGWRRLREALQSWSRL